MLMVPGDFSEDLDEELWSLTKRCDETVQALSRRLKDLVRLFTVLPTNAESFRKCSNAASSSAPCQRTFKTNLQPRATI